MDSIVDKKLNAIIAAYNKLILNIDNDAQNNDERAYGGIIRMGKGMFFEAMTSELVKIAWITVLHQSEYRLDINRKKMPIGLKPGYIERIKNPEVRNFVKKHQNKMIYKFGTDVQVFIDNKMALPIECKAYTENAMIKRILFDAVLMKEVTGVDTYYLVQLESQLGGDYGELNDVSFGSYPTHALMSHVDVNLEIITLLKGDRKVKEPIHKPGFFKTLEKKQLEKTVEIFAAALHRYVK